MSKAGKNELLFQHDLNYNALRAWQKRGIGLYWGEEARQGFNPIKQAYETSQRRVLKVEVELPMKEAYSKFVLSFVKD